MLMEELIALSEECHRKAESETDTAKKNASADREKAIEIRQQTMDETMAQSKKRQAEAADEGVKHKKRRRSGFDNTSWLAS